MSDGKITHEGVQETAWLSSASKHTMILQADLNIMVLQYFLFKHGTTCTQHPKAQQITTNAADNWH